MDAFTERILERARERQRKLLESGDDAVNMPLRELNNAKIETTHVPPSLSQQTSETQHLKEKQAFSDSNSCINIKKITTSENNVCNMIKQDSSTTPNSSPLHTLNIQKENFNMEIKVSSTDNVRVEVQFQEENSDEEMKNNLQNEVNLTNENERELREDGKKRLQKLGKLYAGDEDVNLSSPIYRYGTKFFTENNSNKSAKIDDNNKVEITDMASRNRKGLGGLAELAKNINDWNDDNLTSMKKSTEVKSSTPAPKRTWKPPAPRPPISSVRSTENVLLKSTVRTKPPAPKPPNHKESNQPEIISPSKTISLESNPKQLNLDQTLLKTLESQGFTRTTSNARLIYNYDASRNSPNKSKVTEKELITPENTVEENTNNTETVALVETMCSPKKINVKGSAIASRAALFESISSPIKNNNKDPALLSVSERKALFEKNKGVAPLPKAPISMATPLNVEMVIPKTPVSAKKNISPIKESKSPVKLPSLKAPIKKNDNSASAYKVAPGEPGGIASKMAALFQNKSTISQQQIENNIREQRQKEMDVLLNRYNKNKTVHVQKEISKEPESESDDENDDETAAMINQRSIEIKKIDSSTSKQHSGGKRCGKEDSPKVTAILDDVKHIKVSTKPGRLYPCLSDIEAVTETETEPNTASPSPANSSLEENFSESDMDMANTSFGKEILETVCKNQAPQKRPLYDENLDSDMSDILDDMDDYLDEALASNGVDKSGPTPPKHARSLSPVNEVQPSKSFQYKNFGDSKCSPQKRDSPVKDFKSPSKIFTPRKSEDLPAYVVDGDNVLPLIHTVSFYRKQQNQETKTPVRQIIHNPINEEISSNNSDSTESEDSEVQNKIKRLIEEMTKQQTIISQTSQALNLCYSTPEFTGSTEQVEAEKVLLLATHRRSAAQREIERLSIVKTLHFENKHTENIPLEKGNLSITNIVLPLKRDYVRALNATGGSGHHIVCLVKCSDQVVATQLVSTVATNDRNLNLELNIPGTVNLNNIFSNFTVQFEVYCLRAQEEILPHEVKYHINNKKGNSKMTPKKSKFESRLIKPPKESPGGPLAVRSPTFALMGYVVFSIQGINRKNWTLNNAPSMSPLEGIVEMRIKCPLVMSVEHHGFLTMFEDVSGFGAWHRRWCLLKGNALSYWKYPDDEKKKPPIDTLDLSSCITQQVGPVRRDICARLHTILIETSRLAQPQDKNSLVMECKGNTTIIRHLLSADTKEERIEWCSMLNKAIMVTKMSCHPK